MWRLLHKNNKSPFRSIIFGFLLVILLGSFLLMLPISAKNGEVTPFLHALFTATSAVCVTGLVIYDTATYWSQFGQTVIILLIQIGGSPGSTAGGMKTTTFAVLLVNTLAVFRRREHPSFFNRRISTEAVSQASTVLLMYVVLFLSAGLVISRVEDLPVLTCLFETASAIGTVGLSLGVTPQLSSLSHLILIALMFFGRVGGLTLIFAALSRVQGNSARLPQERITVG